MLFYCQDCIVSAGSVETKATPMTGSHTLRYGLLSSSKGQGLLCKTDGPALVDNVVLSAENFQLIKLPNGN